jgi:hypothetical protein
MQANTTIAVTTMAIIATLSPELLEVYRSDWVGSGVCSLITILLQVCMGIDRKVLRVLAVLNLLSILYPQIEEGGFTLSRILIFTKNNYEKQTLLLVCAS